MSTQRPTAAAQQLPTKIQESSYRSSPSSRQDIVSEVIYKKTYQKLMNQLFPGAQPGLYLSSPLPKNGISSVWTSTMPGSKLTSRIQCGYIFPEDTNPSQPHLHTSDSKKPLLSLSCTLALVSISTKRID